MGLPMQPRLRGAIYKSGVKYIISLKDSENPKNPLYARDKAESQYRMVMIFGPSGRNALKIDMILYWKSLYGSGILLKIIAWEHSLSLYPQMQFKNLLCNLESIYI